MGITVNTSTQQITANVGETKIDVSVGGGVGPTGSQGSSGTVSVSAPITNAGTSTAAVIGLSVGTGLTVSGGSIVLPIATANDRGGVRIGSGVSIDVNGVISVSTAYASSSHAHGFLSSSGTITDGAVSTAFVAAPAVVTLSGFLRQGQFGTAAGTIAEGNHTHAASAIGSGTFDPARLPVATANAIGAVRIGSGISIDGNGVISASAGYTLPTATASVLGGVKIGSGVTITDGVISVSTNYAAATHSHAISDVTGLQTALDGKAASSHTHATLVDLSLNGDTTFVGLFGGEIETNKITLVTPLGSSPASITFADTSVQTTAWTGSVTSSGVTFASTDRLLGRSSAGAGAGQEIVCTAAGRALLDDADAAAQRTTLGLAAIASSGSASDLSTGTVSTARLGTGTATGATFLAGNGEWKSVVSTSIDGGSATTLDGGVLDGGSATTV